MALRSWRLMLEMIAEHVSRREIFAFETTIAGQNFARAIEQWRSASYHVSLIFLSLLPASRRLAGYVVHSHPRRLISQRWLRSSATRGVSSSSSAGGHRARDQSLPSVRRMFVVECGHGAGAGRKGDQGRSSSS